MKNLHSDVTVFLALKLEAANYNVLASIEHWPAGEPIEIAGYKPDIYAFRGVEENIYEVCTLNDLDDSAFLNKLIAFNELKDQRNIIAYLAIPFSSIGLNMQVIKAKTLLKRFKLNHIVLLACDIANDELKFL